MSYYRTCPYCGAALDPCEICDCQKQRSQSEARENAKRTESEQRENHYLKGEVTNEQS